MTYCEENKERCFDDLEITFYITTNYNNYRLLMSYSGVYTDEDPDPINATGCFITLYEVTGRTSSTLSAVADVLTEMGEDVETGEDVIYNTIPDIRRYISLENYNSYDACEEIKNRILETLETIEG